MGDLQEAPTQLSAVGVTAAGGAAFKEAEAERKEQKRRKKVRSAWISFVGRIVAHITGAAATISFGLLVVQQYGLSKTQSAPEAVRAAENDSAPAPGPASRRMATPGGVSIAVLPFETYSRPARPELADAMAEAVIADLSRAKGFRVISRTSTMRYRSERKPLHVIARELGVDLIVEGSVTSAGGRMRVIAQLIDAKRDEHVWTATYDRTLGDVLAVQSDVAAAVARGVQEAVKGAQPDADAPRGHTPTLVPSGSSSTPLERAAPGLRAPTQ